jgi:biopolymer transport protein TolQ
MEPVIAEHATQGQFAFLELFWRADAVVKAVMLGLALASVWCWAIIAERSIALSRLNREDRRFLAHFRDAPKLNAVEAAARNPKGARALYAAAMHEFAQETGDARWNDGMRERIGRALEIRLASETERLETGLPFLATVGSAAPFIGLFGTVWGIMNSFRAIADMKSTSLAVVAPGLAEALFATALGLLAAIPAVIFYNKLANQIAKVNARQEAFGGELMIRLSRLAQAGRAA